MKNRFIYSLAGVGILVVASFLIFQALSSSLVYFILPSEYARNPQDYQNRRIRLAGIVEDGTVSYDNTNLLLSFLVTDSIESYPVSHRGSPPELFEENTGVVVEGRFADGVFESDLLLVKHSEVYEPPTDGSAVDLDRLKDSLY